MEDIILIWIRRAWIVVSKCSLLEAHFFVWWMKILQFIIIRWIILSTVVSDQNRATLSFKIRREWGHKFIKRTMNIASFAYLFFSCKMTYHSKTVVGKFCTSDDGNLAKLSLIIFNISLWYFSLHVFQEFSYDFKKEKKSSEIELLILNFWHYEKHIIVHIVSVILQYKIWLCYEVIFKFFNGVCFI